MAAKVHTDTGGHNHGHVTATRAPTSQGWTGSCHASDRGGRGEVLLAELGEEGHRSAGARSRVVTDGLDREGDVHPMIVEEWMNTELVDGSCHNGERHK